MKASLLALVLLTSLSASAHPTDDELMNTIDFGSALKINKDINMPLNNKILLMDGKTYRTYTEVVGDSPYCRLAVLTNDQTEVNRPYVISREHTITVLEKETPSNQGTIITFKLGKKHILYVACATGFDLVNGGKGVPTIGQFKKVLGDIATIELPNP